MAGFQYRYRKPRNTPEERGGRPPVYSRTLENEHAMLIERDLAVMLRDGTTIYANVFPGHDPRNVDFRFLEKIMPKQDESRLIQRSWIRR